MSTILKQSTSKGTVWAARILTVLVIIPFAISGTLKAISVPMAVEGLTRLGIPQGGIVPLGIVELSCLVIYLVPRTVVVGTLLLTGYLGGAVLANIIGKTDFIHALVVGLLVWAGAWFRVPELQSLIPFRKTT